MSGEPPATEGRARASAGQLDDALVELLRRRDTLLLAAADDGLRVPMPDSLPIEASRTIPLPEEPGTALDLFVPQDSIPVVVAWENAQVLGLSHAHVRLRTVPDEVLSLTFVDARRRHGVWIAALTCSSLDEGPTTSSAVNGALAVPQRPRTATITKDPLAVITGADERATRMLGWTREQFVGTRSRELVHPDDQERAVANWLELLSKKESARIRLRHRCADGGWLWVEIENMYQEGDDPSETTVVAQVSDISDEMAVHEALDRRERLLHRLAESLPSGIVQVASDRSVVYVNSRLRTMLGAGTSLRLPDLLASVVPDDRPALDAALARALEDDEDSELEVGIRASLSGQQRVCSVSVTSLSDREGVPGALMTLTDVTDSVRMREELKTKATFDVLTGCYNRSSVMAVLDEALQTERDLLTAVLFIDLDKLKPINDTYGHGVGDEVLVAAAERLHGVLRHEDVVGRIGGDEFLLVVRGVESTEAVMALAARVRDAVCGPVALSSVTVPLAASIGVACSEPGVDSTTLTRRADQAMYRSKQLGGTTPVLHEPAMEADPA